MLARRSFAVAALALGGCTSATQALPPPASAGPELSPSAGASTVASAPPLLADAGGTVAPPPSTQADPPRAPDSPIVVGSRVPSAFAARGFPRVDRARGVVTVADTGDDRYAFQISLSLLELSAGKTGSRVALEVFPRKRFEALEADAAALDRAVREAAEAVNDALRRDPRGVPMTACTVSRRETDDASGCAAGQTLRCGDLTATYEGRTGQLRHPGGTARHPLWAKTILRSSEHRARFDVVACFREAAFDPETKLLAAYVDRQCVASGGDWCSREPVWTVTSLR